MALTYCSVQFFTTDAATPIQTFMVDSTHFIVFYKDSSNYGKAVIGTISGQTVSYGTVATFISSAIGECRAAKIDNSKYLIAWTYPSGNNYQYLCIASVSGTTISFGSTASYYAYYNTPHTATSYLCVSSSSAFTVGTYAMGNRWTTGSISGTTVSITNESGTTVGPKQRIVCGSYTFALWNEYLGTPYNEWRGVINSISYPLITAGTLSSNTEYSACAVGDYDYAVLDSNHFILVYKKSTSTTNIYCRVITCSSFLIGTEYTVSTSGGSTNYLNVVAFSATSVVFNYVNSSGWVRYRPATISGSTVTFGSDTALSGASSANAVADLISSTCVVSIFRDGNNSNRGAARIGTISTTHLLQLSVSQASSATARLSKEQSLSLAVTQASSGIYTATGRTTHLLQLDVTQGSSVSSELTQHYTHNLSLAVQEASSVAGSMSINGLRSLQLGVTQSTSVLAGLQFYNTGIDFKDRYAFSSGAAYNIKTISIDTTHFLVAWREGDYGYMRVGTVSGNAITYGTIYNITDAYFSGQYDCIVWDKDSSAVCLLFVYGRGTNQPCYARIAKVLLDGSYSITLYSECLVSSNYYAQKISIAYLGSNYFVATFRDGFNSGYGTAVRLYNNSNTIEAGSRYIFKSDNVSETKALPLSSSTALIEYIHGSAENGCYQEYVVASVGSNITFGSPQYISTSVIYYSLLCQIDSSHFLVAYAENDGGTLTYQAKIALGTVSSGTLSFGTATSLSEYPYDILKLNDTRFVASLPTSTANGKVACVINLSGDSITINDSYSFLSASGSSAGTANGCAIDSNKIVMAYNDMTASYYGYARLGATTQIPLKILECAFGAISSCFSTARYTPKLTANIAQSSLFAMSGTYERRLKASISESTASAYNLYRALGLSTQIEQQSYISAHVQRERLLSLALQGLTSATATLDDIKTLRIVVEQLTSASAHAQAQKELATAIEEVSELSAKATRVYSLQSNIQSVTSASLHVIRLIELVDAMQATSTMHSGLSLEQILSAVITQGSSLYTNAYRQLSLGLSVDQLADFSLTLDHIISLVTLIEQESQSSADLGIIHMLKSYIESKSKLDASFYYVFEAAINFFASSSMTAEGRIFHGVELVCAMDAEARAFFTADRTAQLATQISEKASMEAMLQELLRLYFEWKAHLYSGIEFSGLLENQLSYSGKIDMNTIEIYGSLNHV